MVPATETSTNSTAETAPGGLRVLLRVPDLDAARSPLAPLKSLMPPKIAAKASTLGDYIKRITSRILLATVTISAIVLFYVAVQGVPNTDKPDKGDSAKSDAAKTVNPIREHPRRNHETATRPETNKTTSQIAPESTTTPERSMTIDRTADRRASVTEPARREIFSFDRSKSDVPAGTEPQPGTVQFVTP